MNNFLNITLKDRRKAKVYTGILMLLFISLLLLPFFSYQNPPPGQPGLLVSFGAVDAGSGSESAAAPSKPKEEVKPNKPKVKPQPKPKKTKPKTKPKAEPKPKEKPKEVKTPIDEDVITARNEAIALQKQKAQEAINKQAKADAIAQAEADKQAQEKAAQEAAEKAAAQAEAYAAQEAAKQKKATEDFKNSLSNAFGKGSGKGDGGKPGDQGVKDGDPNADALKGLNTGIGMIGGNLTGRGGKGPGISDSSNKTGTVVVYVCIDQNGNVESARFQQRGSTSSDPELVKLATDNANKWGFNKGTSDTTCGTITYDFKVK